MATIRPQWSAMASTRPTPPGPFVRLATRVASARLRLRPAMTGYRVDRDIAVTMRDGVDLLTDVYLPHVPHAEPAGTVLIRTPYGRTNLPAAVTAAVYAERGYQVVMQSVRGTFGSGGDFHPGYAESEDAADTLTWLRDQPWFRGRLFTVGSSYLGYTQWALLMDPPPELDTSVIGMAPHDFAESGWGTGAFALADFLTWSYQVATQEDGGTLRTVVRMVTMPRRLRRPLRIVPLRDAGAKILKDRAPWHESWLRTPDATDPYWRPARLGGALQRTRTPVLLVTGWQDVFLTQTLEQYRRLRDGDAGPALIVGPWTHGDGGGDVLRESLSWLADERFGGVRIFVTGDGWRDLPSWPPPAEQQQWYLSPRAALTPQPVDGQPARFVYDPADPTPTIGGRLLFAPRGYREDSALAARNDVITFTGAVLDRPMEVLGTPSVELVHRTDTGWCDVAVRISEVGADGRSRNVSDGYATRTPADGEMLRLDLDPIAHRFAAGSRIRLSIAGGSYPRFARNPGTGEPVWTASRLVPTTHEIGTRSRLTLPILNGHRVNGF